MAKIILLQHSPSNERLTRAAWHFAYAALWPDQQFAPGEINHALHYIRLHLAGVIHIRKYFAAFCERVMIAAKQAVHTGKGFPSPAIWLHPDYADGYASTQADYEQVASTRRQIPGYEKGMCILVQYYWNRIGHSPTASFTRLRSRLLRLQETALLQLCCTALTYQLFLTVNTGDHGRKEN